MQVFIFDKSGHDKFYFNKRQYNINQLLIRQYDDLLLSMSANSTGNIHTKCVLIHAMAIRSSLNRAY